MSMENPRGLVYRCAVCGAEVLVLSPKIGKFAPRCCNQPMQPKLQRVVFYVCPVCGAEIAVLKKGEGEFRPRCCNTDMILNAA